MAAKLVRVSPETDAGISRVRTASGFRMPDGAAPDQATMKRIDALVLLNLEISPDVALRRLVRE